MNDIYDVAIVGAGPAGAFFARELSKTRPELRILLIDGQNEENKKPCGGLLAPDAQKALAEFDLTLPKSILADPQIFTVETVDLVTRQVRYYQRHYLNMDRYLFDRWLLSLVPDSVTVLSGRVTGIMRIDRVFKLKIGNTLYFADLLVGADGASSIVRRSMGVHLPKAYVSIQEWYTHSQKAMPYYSCIFDKATSDSCSWTVHKDGYIIFGGAYDKKDCKEAFSEQKGRFEAFIGETLGEPVKREACLLTSPRSFGDLVCGGAGFYLIGEAAGFISASSFEGISSAIISAHLLAEAFTSGKTDGILKSYKKRTFKLRIKLYIKMFKRAVLCSPVLRKMIMKSGIQSMNVKN